MLLFFKHNHLREFYLLSAAILNAIVIQNRRFSVRVSNYIVVITQFLHAPCYFRLVSRHLVSTGA